MMMRLAFVCGALVIAGVAAHATAASLSYEDNKMNFKTCEGKNVTARWVGGAGFSISEAGRSPGDVQTSLQYLDWDGACRTLSWNAKAGQFVHADKDGTRANRIVNYVAWDDTRWAATRAGLGFFHARIADAGASVEQGARNRAADGLDKRGSAIPAAAVLAEELRATSAQ